MRMLLNALCFFTSSAALAAITPIATEKSEAPAPKSSAWKVSSGTSFYEMTGTRNATANAYGFGAVSIVGETAALEFAVSPDWKIVGRGQYVSNDYEVVVQNKIFDEKTSGAGDSYLGITHPLASAGSFRLSTDAGASLPTGSFREMNKFSATPSHYKYFMQLGSGTYDGVLGLTSAYLAENFNAGTRISATLRQGQNASDYRLGNTYAASAWFDIPAGLGFTPRLVGGYRLKTAISGADPMVPRAAAEFYYHDQIDWNFATAVKYEHSFARHVFIIAEAGKPLLQGMRNYDDVAISTRFYGNLGIAGQF